MEDCDCANEFESRSFIRTAVNRLHCDRTPTGLQRLQLGELLRYGANHPNTSRLPVRYHAITARKAVLKFTTCLPDQFKCASALLLYATLHYTAQILHHNDPSTPLHQHATGELARLPYWYHSIAIQLQVVDYCSAARAQHNHVSTRSPVFPANSTR